MKIFNSEYLNEKVVEQIKAEKNTYFSKEYNSFMVTDKMFDYLADKYDITTDEDLSEDDKYCFVEFFYNGIEEWINMVFDGEDADFFGIYLEFTEYDECVRLDIEDQINEDTGEITFMKTDDWGKDIERLLKTEISIGFKIKLEEIADKFDSEGYNLNIVTEAFTSAISRRDYRNEHPEVFKD